MSLETIRTEEPLPTSTTAQHQEPKPQQHSHSVTLMSFSTSDHCETPASDLPPQTDIELGVNSDTSPQPEPEPDLEPEPEPEADAQILEALRSAKDRLFVLKLGESMESLIQERHIRNRVELTPASTYHKLLVHRCAAYYKLTPETEAGSKAIAIIVVSESRIPARRVAELVPPDDSPLPAFKIMRRTPQNRTRSKASSQGGSGNDENAGAGDTSDGDPSEAGSSRGSRRRPLTMSERQAQYDEARSRIFKDLEEKEKAKAQDMSASSSTLSLLSVGSSSGGAGGGGGSSVGESLDEAGSVDREWVASPGTDKDSGLRTGSASGSSRSLRSSAPAFNGHGHSPGFIYPTLYEPAPTPSTSSSSSYDSSPSPGTSSQGPYQPTLYPVYQYGTPAYLAPYPPYPYYPYAHPHAPPPPQHLPDSTANSTNGSPASSPADAYPSSVTFMNTYMWGAPPPPPPPPSHPQSRHNQQPQQQPQQQQEQQPRQPPQQHQQQPQPQHTQAFAQPTPEYPHPQYPPAPMHAFTYPPPGPGYLQPPPPPVQHQSQHYSHNAGRPQTVPDGHRPTNPNLIMNHTGGSSSQPQLYQPGAYDAGRGPSAVGGASPALRNGGGPPPPKRMQVRSGWSFGPGMGGSGAGMSGETLGPRMSMGRRTSGSSGVANGYTGSRTPGDETASTASSSTSSSSSRQTFTSTSSKHPLPARPDWAVGLKPQPTLHHSSSHHSSPRSHHGHLPSQSHSHHHGQPRPSLPMPLQSNDFPPLTVSPPSTEKRPALGGVWAGSSTTRSILGPSLGRLNNGSGINGNGAIPSQDSTQQNTRLDEHDRAFERPGPKAGGELFNPNAGAAAAGRVGTKSPPNGVVRKAPSLPEKDKVDKEKANANARCEAIANAILVDHVGTLRIGNENGEEQGGAVVNGAEGDGETP